VSPNLKTAADLNEIVVEKKVVAVFQIYIPIYSAFVNIYIIVKSFFFN